MGCPCSRSDRFAITSHRSRNFVKLISSSAKRVSSLLCGQCRLVAGTIGLAACHDCPDYPCCLVCHRDRCNPHGLSHEQIGQPWIDRRRIVSPCQCARRTCYRCDAETGGSSRGPRIRLRAEFGTAEFWAEYQAALASLPYKPRMAPHEGTLAWLMERYRETTAWSYLSPATRRQRENIFAHILETAGAQPFAKITAAVIMAGRDRRANTPSQARHFLDSMRGLFRWAVKARLIKTDPTVGVDNPPLPKNDGFASWSEDDIAAYERRWAIGTRQRVWLDVVIYTGLRRGDAVRIRVARQGLSVSFNFLFLPRGHVWPQGRRQCAMRTVKPLFTTAKGPQDDQSSARSRTVCLDAAWSHAGQRANLSEPTH